MSPVLTCTAGRWLWVSDCCARIRDCRPGRRSRWGSQVPISSSRRQSWRRRGPGRATSSSPSPSSRDAWWKELVSPEMASSWLMTPDYWLQTLLHDSWLLTPDMASWFLTPDSWHGCPDSWPTLSSSGSRAWWCLHRPSTRNGEVKWGVDKGDYFVMFCKFNALITFYIAYIEEWTSQSIHLWPKDSPTHLL